MCMITLYKGSIKEENKIASDISRYTLNLVTGKLTVYPMLKEQQEFKRAYLESQQVTLECGSKQNRRK
ncbi:MAG: hypothetical protein Q7J85_06830 [Bacillota bacterium]|nr:hypothetical protein [Bacillota bacterium]